MRFVEVGKTDGLNFALSISLFHQPAGCEIIPGGLMNQKQVDIICAETVERFLNRILIFIEGRPELGFEEDFVPGDDASAQMLDLIFDNLYLDNNAIYDFGGSTTTLSSAMLYHTDFASAYAGIETMIQADIDKVEKVY